MPIAVTLVDSKGAPQMPLVDEAPIPPPSYSDATTAPTTSSPKYTPEAFTDVPRGPTMTYAAGLAEPYRGRAEKKGWSFGFFNCFSDPAASAKAFCCPCVSYAQTRHRLHSPNTPAPIMSTPCLGYCLTASCFPGMEFIFGFLQRGDIRNRLEIDHAAAGNIRLGAREEASRRRYFESVQTAGGFVDDVWRHFFCGCCSLVQEDREVRAWELERAQGGLEEFDEDAVMRRGVVGEEGIREEGERLLGREEENLVGLRG